MLECDGLERLNCHETMFNQLKSSLFESFHHSGRSYRVGLPVLARLFEWFVRPDQGLAEPPVLDLKLHSRLMVMLPKALLMYSFDLRVASLPMFTNTAYPRLIADRLCLLSNVLNSLFRFYEF